MKTRMALVLATLAFAGCGAPADRPESLVLVVIDTLRQDHVGVYGAGPSPTPFLDQLARDGCAADGRSPTSWTRPAMATVFSGLHPLVHQVISPSDLVSLSVPLLAEPFERSGFATVAVIGNSVVAKKWGFGRGFERFVDVQSDLGRLPSAEEINRQVAVALEGVRPPYFLYVHYMDPHLPYDPDRDRLGRPLEPARQQAGPVTDESLRAALAGSAPLDLDRIRDLYDGEVRRADDGVRGLLALLEERGLRSRTLVSVVSDHGEELLDHGGFGHGRTLFEEVVRVPLIFHGPGIVAPNGRLGPFPLEDLAPSLAGLFALERESQGAEAEPGHGHDRATEVRTGVPAASTAPTTPRLAHLDFVEGAALSLQQERWKLVLGALPYRKELYDLESDPHEERNLIAAPEAVVARDRAAAELARRFNRLSRAAVERVTTGDEEIARQLRALGYLGAAQKPVADRRFPPRLRAADGDAYGLRGWEPAEGLEPCVERDGAARRQELFGWEETEQRANGRFSLYFAAPAEGSGRWTLSGRLARALRATISVTVQGQEAKPAREVAGSFELGGDARPERTGEPVVLTFEVRSTGVTGSSPTTGTMPLRIDRVCFAPAR